MKRILAGMILAGSLMPLGALDFGVDLSSITSATVDTGTSLYNDDRLDLWVAASGDSWDFSLRGFYQFRGSFDLDNGDYFMVPLRLDVGETWFRNSFASLMPQDSDLTVTAGRFAWNDLSGHVYNGLADGVEGNFSLGGFKLAALASYTGLLPQDDLRIFVSDADYADYIAANGAYCFGPQRVVGALRMTLQEIFLRHDLALEIMGQADLRVVDPVHTGYATLRMNGILIPGLKWKAWGTGGARSDTTRAFFLATGGQMQWAIPEAGNLNLALKADWAGAGIESGMNAFTTITQEKLGTIFDSTFSDMLTVGTKIAASPVKGLIMGLDARMFLRTSAEAPEDPEFLPGGTAVYMGTECMANLDLAISSELKLTLEGGAFLPNTADDAYGSTAVPRLYGKLTVLMMF